MSKIHSKLYSYIHHSIFIVIKYNFISFYTLYISLEQKIKKREKRYKGFFTYIIMYAMFLGFYEISLTFYFSYST